MFAKEIAEFQARLVKASHIEPLLKDHEVHVWIKCNDDAITLHILEREVKVANQSEDSAPDIIIEGAENMVREALAGNQALRKMENQGSLIIKGNLREVLWLESIFLLSRDNPAPSVN